MSQRKDERRSDGGPEPSSSKRRFTVGGVVGGAVMIVILFVVDRLRPGRRSQESGSQPRQVPASETPAAGTVEAITGPRPAPPGVHTSVSSPWPMVLAGAVAFTAFGIVTNLAFSLFGVIVMVVAIVGWVGEMLNE